MAEFPAAPLPAAEFFESWLPKAFAEADIPESQRSVDARIGVLLHGDGGGEWVMHVNEGALQVSAEPRSDCAFTYVQSVDHWRGALWEGKGGAIGAQSAQLFKPGAQLAQSRPGQGPPSPQALAGAEGGDWHVDFKLGPGAIPEEPTTTLTIAAEDADAMAAGTLDPMAAFMQGKILVAGDMALMMQMQAIQMQAAAQAAQPPKKDEG
jgi:putative sterol carrier protein